MYGISDIFLIFFKLLLLEKITRFWCYTFLDSLLLVFLRHLSLFVLLSLTICFQLTLPAMRRAIYTARRRAQRNGCCVLETRETSMRHSNTTWLLCYTQCNMRCLYKVLEISSFYSIEASRKNILEKLHICSIWLFSKQIRLICFYFDWLSWEVTI